MRAPAASRTDKTETSKDETTTSTTTSTTAAVLSAASAAVYFLLGVVMCFAQVPHSLVVRAVALVRPPGRGEKRLFGGPLRAAQIPLTRGPPRTAERASSRAPFASAKVAATREELLIDLGPVFPIYVTCSLSSQITNSLR